jgi:hypothetical protein
MVANNNANENPILNGISRTNDAGLNPVPAPTSGAWNKTRKDYPAGDFYDQVNYLGAFGETNWALNWTALDFNGVFGDVVSSVKEKELSGNLPKVFALSQNYPNPFNPTTNIDFALPATEMVDLSIFNILGQKVVTLINGVRKAGTYSVQFDATELSSGWYIYRLQTESNILSRKMLLIK